MCVCIQGKIHFFERLSTDVATYAKSATTNTTGIIIAEQLAQAREIIIEYEKVRKQQDAIKVLTHAHIHTHTHTSYIKTIHTQTHTYTHAYTHTHTHTHLTKTKVLQAAANKAWTALNNRIRSTGTEAREKLNKMYQRGDTFMILKSAPLRFGRFLYFRQTHTHTHTHTYKIHTTYIHTYIHTYTHTHAHSFVSFLCNYYYYVFFGRTYKHTRTNTHTHKHTTNEWGFNHTIVMAVIKWQ